MTSSTQQGLVRASKRKRSKNPKLAAFAEVPSPPRPRATVTSEAASTANSIASSEAGSVCQCVATSAAGTVSGEVTPQWEALRQRQYSVDDRLRQLDHILVFPTVGWTVGLPSNASVGVMEHDEDDTDAFLAMLSEDQVDNGDGLDGSWEP